MRPAQAAFNFAALAVLVSKGALTIDPGCCTGLFTFDVHRHHVKPKVNVQFCCTSLFTFDFHRRYLESKVKTTLLRILPVIIRLP